MQIIQKKVADLTQDEKTQLSVLIKTHYPSARESFIRARTSIDKGYDFVLLKSGDTILGANLYRLVREKKNWWYRTRCTIQFGLAIKQNSYKGNIIWRLGMWYAKKNAGISCLFHNTIGLTTIISPKVFENFIQLFPDYYAEHKDEESSLVLQYVKNHLKMRYQEEFDWCDDGFCFNSFQDLGIEDITDRWEQTFKAKQDWINEFFIAKGIIQKIGNRIYKMPRHILVCGIRQPFSFGYNKLELLRS